MLSKSEIGSHGESIACKFLKKEGYKILERNIRKLTLLLQIKIT